MDDRLSIEEVYREYFTEVWRFTYKLSGSADTADEITQETFFRAMKSLKSFKGGCKLSVWLCQIAKNLYFDRLKKYESRRVSLDGLEPEGESRDPDERLRLMELHRAIHQLPEPYREVFTLKVFGDLTHEEIAGLFGHSVSWSKITYVRAKEKLREKIKEGDK